MEKFQPESSTLSCPGAAEPQLVVSMRAPGSDSQSPPERACPGAYEPQQVYSFRPESRQPQARTKSESIELSNPYEDLGCGDVQIKGGDKRFARMQNEVNSLIGHTISEFDKHVPNDLGCARSVGLALERTYHQKFRAVNTVQLEQELKGYGWDRVPVEQMRPGDVLIGKREAGQHGHAAIYMGHGEIFNNNADEEKMQMDDFFSVFYGPKDEDDPDTYEPDFKEVRVFRKR